MSHVTRRGPVKPQLNITPLIDVVFLLIVFFMIVNNIVTDEQPKMVLPDIDKPETFEPEGESRVVINIVPFEEVSVKPEPGLEDNDIFQIPTPSGGLRERNTDVFFLQVGGKKFMLMKKEGTRGVRLSDEARAEAYKQFVEEATAAIKQRYTEYGNKPPLILLRCDAAVKYESVYPVLTLVVQSIGEALGPELAATTPVHIVAYLEEE